MAEWRIERRRGACAECEREFADGERHVSTLSLGEETLTRTDLCVACWRGQDRHAGEAGPPEGGNEGIRSQLLWWRTRHHVGGSNTLRLDLAALEALFDGLEHRPEQRLRELRFVLCLLLLRKRRLKVERIERAADEESFIVKRPRVDRRSRVFVHELGPERAAELRADLQALFDGADVTAEELAQSQVEPAQPDAEAADDAPGPATNASPRG